MHRYHWGFDDPAKFGEGEGDEKSEEEKKEEFRRVRDQIQLVFGAYASGLKEGMGWK